jgi:CheY-like chemotaxis protein
MPGNADPRNRAPRPVSGTTPRIARVLVIDDDLLVADAIRLVLADDFDVTATTDATHALERLTSGDWYDVILCDVMMPKMNGVELRNRVHAFDANLASRIVFVTGGILLENVQKMLESVPNLVLAKPFDFASVRELIRRRTASDAAASPVAPGKAVDS